MARLLEVDATRVVTRLPHDYPHIGVYDVKGRKAYAARNGEKPAIECEHAELFTGKAATVVKDRFICFWFHPPGTREGLLQGYPIDWTEFHLLVRLDPRWSYVRQALLPAHATPTIEANINHQVAVAAHLMRLYREHGLDSAVSVHLIGPRATDSLFYAHRWEPKY